MWTCLVVSVSVVVRLVGMVVIVVLTLLGDRTTWLVARLRWLKCVAQLSIVVLLCVWILVRTVDMMLRMLVELLCPVVSTVVKLVLKLGLVAASAMGTVGGSLMGVGAPVGCVGVSKGWFARFCGGGLCLRWCDVGGLCCVD